MTTPAFSSAQPATAADGQRLDTVFTPALLFVNGTLIAGIYAFAKVAGAAGISPIGVLAWQVLFAAVSMAIVVALRGEFPQLNRSNLRYAALAGVLGVTGPNLLTFSALPHLPAGLVGVITSLSPIFTYAIALALGAERPNLLRASGIAIGLAGVLSIVLPRGALPSAAALPWALLALGAPLMLASGNVFRTLAWPQGLKPMSAAALLLGLQALVLVPVAIAGGEFVAPRALFRPEDVALLGAGALTAAFYLGAFELQKRGGPVVVGQLGYVITVASLAIGWAVFDERYRMSTFAAVAVVLLGVTLVNRQSTAGGRR